MTEVKMGSKDLQSGQLMRSRKRENKSADGVPGFLAVLKNSTQKKSNKTMGNGSSSEEMSFGTEMRAEDGTEAGTEAAVLAAVIETTDIQHPESYGESTEPVFSDSVMTPEKTEKKGAVIQEITGQNPEPAIHQEVRPAVLSKLPVMKTAEPFSDLVKEESRGVFHRSSSREKSDLMEKDPGKILNSISEKAGELPERFWREPVEKPEKVHMTIRSETSEELEAKLPGPIVKQIHEGNQELDIQLEPYNLGKIRVKISYEDDQIHVSLMCTESRTLKLLSQSAGSLGSVLESNLERPFQVLVDRQEPDYLNRQQEQGGRQQQDHQQQNGQQESPGEKNSGEFLQKLRLGIFETEDAGDSGDGYR